jgi:hypothetical protein
MHWPKLETIQLYGVHLSPSIAARFLGAHPSIRSFSVIEATPVSQFIKSDEFDFLNPEPPSTLSFQPNTLPNITNMLAPRYLTNAILASPTPSPRPIQKLSIQLTDESLKLIRGLPSLEDISVGTTTPDQLTSLALIHPNIVVLSAKPVR